MTKQWKSYACCLTVLALTFVVRDYAMHGPLSYIDPVVASFFYRIRSPFFVDVFYFVTLFAESSVVIALAFLLGLFLWIKKQRFIVALLVASLFIGEFATLFGKLFFHRLRPDLAHQAIQEVTFSFPSGHAATVAVFYGFIAYLLCKTYKSRRIRGLILCAFAVGVFLVDVSRLYLGVHYLSDVIAGNLVGLAGLFFTLVFADRVRKRFRTSDSDDKLSGTDAVRFGLIALVLIVPFFLTASFA